jgi:hypothetical protein
MYSQAIGGVIQSAVRMAKEVWWHKVLKDLASIAAKESSREGIRWFASRGARSKGKPLQKKLEELGKMHRDGLISSEEYAALRKRIIDAAGPGDL